MEFIKQVILAMDFKIIKIHLLTYLYWLLNIWGDFWRFLQDPKAEVVLTNISLLIGIILSITAIGYTIHRTIYVIHKKKKD